MTPFPHLKETSQEAGGTPGVKKFQRKLQMNFKEDFFLGHPVVFLDRVILCFLGRCRAKSVSGWDGWMGWSS